MSKFKCPLVPFKPYELCSVFFLKFSIPFHSFDLHFFFVFLDFLLLRLSHDKNPDSTIGNLIILKQ
ncbi:hypothetical protein DERP_007004 [Dermatophagoides pteronyssinus]|uniref:Uncharacterized protein n=1 Tax=Dermatophagoides pteronyssinus TaxID=6956 RepID=A0ABQ8JTX1_DERPT|nr:hypothetical protein DERP_007004 [Dermatophagoides pteronyssinus]